MERSPNDRYLMARRAAVPLIALALAGALCQGAWAQDTSGKPETAPAAPPAVAKDCGEANVTATPLPNSARALQQREQVTLLASGPASAATRRKGHDGSPPLCAAHGERTMRRPQR